MTDDGRAVALNELLVAAGQPPNGGMAELDLEISRYESRYEMSSDELLDRLKEGEQVETGDIASWLIAVDLRRRIREREARTA